jgi:hypothetical protein
MTAVGVPVRAPLLLIETPLGALLSDHEPDWNRPGVQVEWLKVTEGTAVPTVNGGIDGGEVRVSSDTPLSDTVAAAGAAATATIATAPTTTGRTRRLSNSRI